MCIPKFVEPEWIVPGYEPIIDEQMEDECYNKFLDLSKMVFNVSFKLLWFQCSNDSVLSELNTLLAIVTQIKNLSALPRETVNQNEVLEVLQRMATYKEDTPDPAYQADLRKMKIISEVTIEKIQYQGTTWEKNYKI